MPNVFWFGDSMNGRLIKPRHGRGSRFRQFVRLSLIGGGYDYWPPAVGKTGWFDGVGWHIEPTEPTIPALIPVH